MQWFDVDKSGLAAILERRGKSFAVFELVQNAWDATGVSKVSIELTPIDGVPYAKLVVDDDSPEGWANVSDAFTMFSRSRRAGDATKRGRFSLGEKLVLSLCREATIVTTTGTIRFTESGRRNTSERSPVGTRFEGEIRLTREELRDVAEDIARLIPPVPTTFNGEPLARPNAIKSFEAKLPTVIADADGNLRPTSRLVTIVAYPTSGDAGGEILEMGVPICSADFPWRLNVLQKVPLGLDRDAVTDGFRRALQVAAVNALSETISEEQAAEPWCDEAAADSRISKDAMEDVLDKKFGERRVVAVPNDPIANATAAATGATLIFGGSLPSGAHANMRKFGLTPTSSAAFPTAKPEDAGDAPKFCPLCKQTVR